MAEMDRVTAALERWQAVDDGRIAETPAALVHRVRLPASGARLGREAVLKVYRKGHPGNEAAGIALMQAWHRAGTGSASGAMVEVIDVAPDAVLMARLDGPSLGLFSRRKQDMAGCVLLATTARRLHAAPPGATPELLDLGAWFDALFVPEFAADCRAELRRDVGRAADLARRLLGSQPERRPLHGDLHHDNVIVTPQGPVAFDAKGLYGDPAYELANALRRPAGVPETVRDPARIHACLTHYAKAMQVSRVRLAGWAAAKCALSIVWSSDGPLSEHEEQDLLSLLLAIAETSSAQQESRRL